MFRPISSDKQTLLGQVPPNRDNLKDLFTLEVLSYFYKKNVFRPLLRTRDIPEGNKSAVFEVSGKAAKGVLFKPGDTLDKKGVPHARKIINIDGLVVASAWIFKLDDWLAYWDVRHEHAQALGVQLAEAVDRNLFASVLKAAATDKALVKNPDGTEKTLSGKVINMPDSSDIVKVSDIDSKDDVILFFEAVRKARTTFRKMNVYDQELYLAISPSMYEKLFNYLDLISADYKGSGSIAEGELPRLFGFNIVESNVFYEGEDGDDNDLGELYTVPGDTNTEPEYKTATIGEDWSGDGGINHKVTVKGGGLLAVAFTRDAAAMVNLKDIYVEEDYDIKEKATYITADLAAGFDSFRPECAIAIMGKGGSLVLPSVLSS